MLKEDFTKYFLQNIIDINNAYDILKNFQKNYGKDFIINMTLDDYCIGFGRNDTYSYQLEIGTKI